MGLKYEPSLDGLRAIAVVAVVAYHARAPFALGGSHGVDVFFVLSGYLITSILRDGSVRVGEFWRRRFVRLMPALVVVVAITWALTPLLAPQYAARRTDDALLALSYTMNLPMGVRPWDGPFMHTWSLAVEMQFYLLWPFVLPFLMRRRPILALLTLWAALSAIASSVDAFTPLTGYYLVHVSGLALGAAVAFLPAAPVALGWAAVAALAACFATLGLPTVLVEASTATLICGLRQPSILRTALSWDPLVRLGLISYGVYLWHFPIHCAVEHTVWWFRGPVALWGGVVMGTLSYVAVERPVARWLRPSASARPAAA